MPVDGHGDIIHFGGRTCTVTAIATTDAATCALDNPFVAAAITLQSRVPSDVPSRAMTNHSSANGLRSCLWAQIRHSKKFPPPCRISARAPTSLVHRLCIASFFYRFLIFFERVCSLAERHIARGASLRIFSVAAPKRPFNFSTSWTFW